MGGEVDSDDQAIGSDWTNNNEIEDSSNQSPDSVSNDHFVDHLTLKVRSLLANWEDSEPQINTHLTGNQSITVQGNQSNFAASTDSRQHFEFGQGNQSITYHRNQSMPSPGNQSNADSKQHFDFGSMSHSSTSAHISNKGNASCKVMGDVLRHNPITIRDQTSKDPALGFNRKVPSPRGSSHRHSDDFSMRKNPASQSRNNKNSQSPRISVNEQRGNLSSETLAHHSTPNMEACLSYDDFSMALKNLKDKMRQNRQQEPSGQNKIRQPKSYAFAEQAIYQDSEEADPNPGYFLRPTTATHLDARNESLENEAERSWSEITVKAESFLQPCDRGGFPEQDMSLPQALCLRPASSVNPRASNRVPQNLIDPTVNYNLADTPRIVVGSNVSSDSVPSKTAVVNMNRDARFNAGKDATPVEFNSQPKSRRPRKGAFNPTGNDESLSLETVASDSRCNVGVAGGSASAFEFNYNPTGQGIDRRSRMDTRDSASNNALLNLTDHQTKGSNNPVDSNNEQRNSLIIAVRSGLVSDGNGEFQVDFNAGGVFRSASGVGCSANSRASMDDWRINLFDPSRNPLRDHPEANYSPGDLASYSPNNLANNSLSNYNFDTAERETPPLSASSLASSRRLEWDNGADIGYSIAILNSNFQQGGSRRTIPEMARSDPEGISLMNDSLNVGPSSIPFPYFGFRSEGSSSMNFQQDASSQASSAVVGDQDSRASSAVGDQDSQASSSVGDQDSRASSAVGDRDSPASSAVGDRDSRASSVADGDVQERSSSPESLSRSDSKKSVIYNSVRDMRSSKSLNSKSGSPRLRQSSRNVSCPDLTDLGPNSLGRHDWARESLSKSEERVGSGRSTKTFLFPGLMTQRSMSVRRRNVGRQSSSEMGGLYDRGDILVDIQDEESLHHLPHTSCTTCQAPYDSAGDRMLMNISHSKSEKPGEEEVFQFAREVEEVFDDVPRVDTMVEWVDDYPRPILVVSNDPSELKGGNLSKIVGSFFENHASDHGHSEVKPHIRWYPFAPANAQDIKDVSTQTAMSFVARQSTREAPAQAVFQQQTSSPEDTTVEIQHEDLDDRDISGVSDPESPAIRPANRNNADIPHPDYSPSQTVLKDLDRRDISGISDPESPAIRSTNQNNVKVPHPDYSDLTSRLVMVPGQTILLDLDHRDISGVSDPESGTKSTNPNDARLPLQDHSCLSSRISNLESGINSANQGKTGIPDPEYSASSSSRTLNTETGTQSTNKSNARIPHQDFSNFSSSRTLNIESGIRFANQNHDFSNLSSSRTLNSESGTNSANQTNVRRPRQDFSNSSSRTSNSESGTNSENQMNSTHPEYSVLSSRILNLESGFLSPANSLQEGMEAREVSAFQTCRSCHTDIAMNVPSSRDEHYRALIADSAELLSSTDNNSTVGMEALTISASGRLPGISLASYSSPGPLLM